MSSSDSTKSLEAEWELDTGFFGKVREGQFDPVAFERTRKKLQNMVIDEDADIPRRLVSLLWYMPIFLSWQTERVQKVGHDVKSYIQAVTLITNEIERLLGTP